MTRRKTTLEKALRLSLGSHRQDPLYPKIERVVDGLLDHGYEVAPVEVLVGMGFLRPERLADWRAGRVPYLEQVIDYNLERLSAVLRILRLHAEELDLAARTVEYVCESAGSAKRLRFTRTDDARTEAAYATHYGRKATKP